MTQAAESSPAGDGLIDRAQPWRPTQRLPRGAWVAGLPALVTLGVTTYQLNRPSLWRDEGATLAAVRRSLPELVRMLGNVDAVHSVYYFFMWFWVRLAGTSVTAVRLPSAIGMAVTAAVVAVIGRRLVSARAGLAAGLVFAVLPDVTWYGQNAREYGIVGTIATVASYLLIRVLDAEPARRRRWLVLYSASLAALGLTSVLALLLIPAHAVTVLLAQRRGPDSATDGPRPDQPPGEAGPSARRGLVAGWLTAAVAAGIASSPLALVSATQQNQVSWIKPPRAASFVSASRLVGHSELLIALLVIVAAAVAVPVLRRRRAPGALAAAWPQRLPALAVPWLLVPFALLITVSLIHPYYQPRYLVYCIPAAALLAGTALSALGWAGGAAGLAVILAAAWPAQLNARHAGSHGENLRQLAHLLSVHARPGDAVLFAGRNTREFEAAYPGPYRRLRDVGRGRTAVASATLTGTDAPPTVVRARLGAVHRLWVIETGTTRGQVPVLAGLGFSEQHKWVAPGGIWLVLYAR